MDISGLSDSDLATLIKALHEARFPQEESDPTVWLAPFVIQLHVDALEERARRVGAESPAGALPEWIHWRGRPEHQIVMRRIREDSSLRTLIRGDPTIMRRLLRPFEVDDTTLAQFEAAARESHG